MTEGRIGLSPGSVPGRRRGHQLAMALRAEIARRHWSVGERMSSTRAIAARYGVSLNTVREALEVLTREGLVITRAGSGVYVSALPRSAASQGQQRWGVLIPSTGYFARTIDGIESVGHQSGAQISLSCSQYDRSRELTQVRRMVRDGATGLIMAPTGELDEDTPMWRDLLAEITVPTVFVERVPPRSGQRLISHVSSDMRAGTRFLVEHVIAQGRRRIGFLAPDLQPHEMPVLEGFTDALHHADLELVSGALETAGGEQQLLAAAGRISGQDLDAIFVLRPGAVFPILAALRSQGLQVPRDVTLMGSWAQMLESAGVPYCGMTLPRYELGVMAANLMVQLTAADSRPSVCHAHYTPPLWCQGAGCDNDPMNQPIR